MTPASAALTPAHKAEIRGYLRGRHDLTRGVGILPVNFFTAEEWNAWLRGWRCGQEDLRAELALDRSPLDVIAQSGYNSTADGS